MRYNFIVDVFYGKGGATVAKDYSKIYSKKNRYITLSPRELYKKEKVKQRAKLEKQFNSFGMNLIGGEYTARIFFTVTAIALFAAFFVVGSWFKGISDEQTERKQTLLTQIAQQQYIADYERDVVVKTDYIDAAARIAQEIAVVQNKYIIAVVEQADDFEFADIDYEMRGLSYLDDPHEEVPWINIANKETLREMFLDGDYYWSGYADTTLRQEKPSSLPVFFVLYNGGYPVMVVEYTYWWPTDTNTKGVLKNRNDWG